MVVSVNGTTFHVDTTDLPELFTVRREDEGYGASVVRVNRPRTGTRYLCIDWYGRMQVTELCDYEFRGSIDSGRARLGSQRVSERICQQVTVIGAVVGEVTP